jgi:hypothetical protein
MTNSEFCPGFLGIVLLYSVLVTPKAGSALRAHAALRIMGEDAGAIMTPARRQNRRLRGLQIGRSRFAAAPVGFDVEGKLLTLNQTAHAGALDGGDMHEHIGTAAVLRDEAVALLGVEKLDSTLSHHGPPLANALGVFAAARTIRAVFNPDFAWSWEWPFASAGRYGKAS